MLNRRILRIEVLQTLFAFVQGKNSLKQLVRDNLAAKFNPDLSSMENQDLKGLAVQKREALRIYDSQIDKIKPACKNDDPLIESLVNEAFQEYKTRLKKEFDFFRKQMVKDVESTYTTYLFVLQLLVEFKNVATILKTKLGSKPENFVKNLLIRKIEYDNSLQHTILANKVSWEPYQEQVREWYREIIRKDEKFQDYLSLSETEFEKDKEIANYILRELILRNEIIGSFLEELDIKWSEHESVIKGMIKKTMKEVREEDEFPKITISSEWEEDKEFFEELFTRAVEEERTIDELIAKKTRNWELDRIALTDKIILGLAVAELKNFSNIPVKVTINEYIEVSKRYSTPKSKEFINGVLDGITKDLTEKGLIRKTGKGLLDNK